MILIVGATGKTGLPLVRELALAGAATRVLLRDPGQASLFEGLEVEILHGDLGRRDTLAPALCGVDRVYLTSPNEQALEALQGNLVALARAAGVSHLVKLSALNAGSDAPVEELRRHARIEQTIANSGIPFTHLRPNYFMQNTLRYARSVREEGVIHGMFGTGRISMVDARDIAAVACRVLLEDGHAGRVYDITGPEALTFAQVAGILSEVLGRTVRYVEVPDEEAHSRMAAWGVPAWHTPQLVKLYRMFREGSAGHVSPVVREVGRRPPRTYRRFAEEFADRFHEG